MSVRATPRDWKQAHGSIGKMQQTLFGQARTLRLQLQDRLGMEIISNNCIFPWIIKHSQFLLNRYMTHEDGQTSYFRRWKKDYQTGLCEFGETVLFRMPGKLKDKADTAWHEGIWLGKDTEADESLVFGNGTMHKARTVRRVVPSKQWNKKLHQALNVTPWDPKGKDTTDTTFVLPPTLGVAGRIREPPGLELPDTEQAPEAEEKSETDGYGPSTPRDDVESLKSLPRETDVRHPPTERTPNPKRAASDELSDEDTQEHKRLTVGALFDITAFTACVASVTVGDTEVPVSRNEDTEELTRELGLTEPCLNHVEPELTEEEVKDGMKLEMNSMKGFEVYDEIPVENCSQNDIDNALDCTWVKRRKTPRKVRCRPVARGCFQEAMDTDDTFASTPTLVTLRVLLLLSLSRCWTVLTCDISTAFLHAPMTERLFMKPPVEFYPDNNCLWLLKRAMYGLKQAPALWQTHFAKTMISLGFHRCKTDPNLYVHSSKELYVLCHVDDLLVCGNPDRIKPFTEQLSKEVLLKIEGELKPQTSVNFLGRTLKHNGDSIDITMSPAYVSDALTLFGMDTAKPSPTTGTSAKPSHVPQPLNTSEHKAYRAIVGKLLWLALIRPDISYATKELSRGLTAPTTESVTKVKHLLRYISGTRDHCQRLNPSVTLSDSDCTLDIDCYVDSDWAGCKTTRKSTSGTVVQLLNSTVSFGSRTQGTIALSSGEAELYAIGQGTSEALFVKNLIIEAKMAKSVNITVHTDSTAGKSMATRFGTSKKTKHVELRFLYVQELVAKGILKLKKIGTKDNCADVLTKYLSSELLLSHLKKLCVFGFSNRFQLWQPDDGFTKPTVLNNWHWTVKFIPDFTGGEVARTHIHCIDRYWIRLFYVSMHCFLATAEIFLYWADWREFGLFQLVFCSNQLSLTALHCRALLHDTVLKDGNCRNCSTYSGSSCPDCCVWATVHCNDGSVEGWCWHCATIPWDDWPWGSPTADIDSATGWPPATAGDCQESALWQALWTHHWVTRKCNWWPLWTAHAASTGWRHWPQSLRTDNFARPQIWGTGCTTDTGCLVPWSWRPACELQPHWNWAVQVDDSQRCRCISWYHCLWQSVGWHCHQTAGGLASLPGTATHPDGTVLGWNTATGRQFCSLTSEPVVLSTLCTASTGSHVLDESARTDCHWPFDAFGLQPTEEPLYWWNCEDWAWHWCALHLQSSLVGPLPDHWQRRSLPTGRPWTADWTALWIPRIDTEWTVSTVHGDELFHTVWIPLPWTVWTCCTHCVPGCDDWDDCQRDDSSNATGTGCNCWLHRRHWAHCSSHHCPQDCWWRGNGDCHCGCDPWLTASWTSSHCWAAQATELSRLWVDWWTEVILLNGILTGPYHCLRTINCVE